MSNFSIPFTPSGPKALSLRSKTVSLAPASIRASPSEFYNTRDKINIKMRRGSAPKTKTRDTVTMLCNNSDIERTEYFN